MPTLTVLGACGAWPEAGDACSGFLLEHDEYRVVLDLGYATLPKLLTHRPGGDVDAVVITHQHADHCADLHALHRARYYAPSPPPRVPLYCPPGVVERLRAFDPSIDLEATFEIHHLPGEYRAGPFSLSAVPLPHHVPNAGIRLAAPGATIAYTGDTGPDDALARLGADADLYIMDATYQDERAAEAGGLLLTATDAGRWAARAGAKRLLLTHLWPGSDPSISRAEAAAAFGGEITVARQDLVVSW